MIPLVSLLSVSGLIATVASASPAPRANTPTSVKQEEFVLQFKGGGHLNGNFLRPASWKLDYYNYTDIRVFTPQLTFDLPTKYTLASERRDDGPKFLTYYDPSDPILDEPNYYHASFKSGFKPGPLFLTCGENGGEVFEEQTTLSFNKDGELQLDGNPNVWFMCLLRAPGDQTWDKNIKPVPHDEMVLTTSSLSVEQKCIGVKIVKASPMA